MKLVLMSDTHGLHEQVEVPTGDVLVHAGDFTRIGRREEVIQFNAWLGQLPHKHKIVIAGNHDLSFENSPDEVQPLLTNATYLKDNWCGIAGIGKIYGSPWTPTFQGDPRYRWVFNADPENMSRSLSKILVTHGPPDGILDRTLEGAYAGSPELRAEVFGRINPKIHVFGHIHEGYGHYRANETEFFNASVVDRAYRVRNAPWVVDVETV